MKMAGSACVTLLGWATYKSNAIPPDLYVAAFADIAFTVGSPKQRYEHRAFSVERIERLRHLFATPIGKK